MGVRRQGFALIVVLIAVAAIFALAMQGAVMSRSTMLEVGAIHQRVVAERRARAAVVIALTGLTPQTSGAGPTALADAGSGPAGGGTGGAATPPEKKSIELPDSIKALVPQLNDVEDKAKDDIGDSVGVAARVTDGHNMSSRVPRARALTLLSSVGLPTEPVRVEVDGADFSVRMWDATGLLNINRADENQLVRYFRAKGVGESRGVALAEQIIDWRDADKVPHEHGAEDEAYKRMGVEPRNADIFALEELLFLPAMDRALYESIEDDLAVGGDGLIHAGTAPPAVLASLPGMTNDAVQGIIQLREHGNLTEETIDDVLPATSRDAIKSMLRFKLSSVLRVRVNALEKGTNHVAARFDGAALLTEVGVQEVGLRPM